MSSSTVSQYDCIDCHVTIPLSPPPGRVYVALVIAALQLALTPLGLTWFLLRTRSARLLRIRQPLALALVTVGLFCGIVYPLRDVVGPARFPCGVLLVFAYLCVVMVAGGSVTRGLGVYKLHLRQIRVAAAIVRRDSCSNDLRAQLHRLKQSTAEGEEDEKEEEEEEGEATTPAATVAPTTGTPTSDEKALTTTSSESSGDTSADGGSYGSGLAVASSRPPPPIASNPPSQSAARLRENAYFDALADPQSGEAIKRGEASATGVVSSGSGGGSSRAHPLLAGRDWLQVLADALPLGTLLGQLTCCLLGTLPLLVVFAVRAIIWGIHGRLMGVGPECDYLDGVDLFALVFAALPPLVLALVVNRRLAKLADAFVLREELRINSRAISAGLLWFLVGKALIVWDLIDSPVASDFAIPIVGVLHSCVSIWMPLILTYTVASWRPTPGGNEAAYAGDGGRGSDHFSLATAGHEAVRRSMRRLSQLMNATSTVATAEEGGGGHIEAQLTVDTAAGRPRRTQVAPMPTLPPPFSIHKGSNLPPSGRGWPRPLEVWGSGLPSYAPALSPSTAGLAAVGAPADSDAQIATTAASSSGLFAFPPRRSPCTGTMTSRPPRSARGSSGSSADSLPIRPLTATAAPPANKVQALQAILRLPRGTPLRGEQLLVLTQALVFTQLGRAHFRRCLAREFALENMLFLLDCQRYREAAQHAARLWHTHVAEEGGVEGSPTTGRSVAQSTGKGGALRLRPTSGASVGVGCYMGGDAPAHVIGVGEGSWRSCVSAGGNESNNGSGFNLVRSLSPTSSNCNISVHIGLAVDNGGRTDSAAHAASARSLAPADLSPNKEELAAGQRHGIGDSGGSEGGLARLRVKSPGATTPTASAAAAASSTAIHKLQHILHRFCSAGADMQVNVSAAHVRRLAGALAGAAAPGNHPPAPGVCDPAMRDILRLLSGGPVPRFVASGEYDRYCSDCLASAAGGV